jgi:hypothetical protein
MKNIVFLLSAGPSRPAFLFSGCPFASSSDEGKEKCSKKLRQNFPVARM